VPCSSLSCEFSYVFWVSGEVWLSHAYFAHALYEFSHSDVSYTFCEVLRELQSVAQAPGPDGKACSAALGRATSMLSCILYMFRVCLHKMLRNEDGFWVVGSDRK
jgi:hypothetical protein